jgi:hypothetical protein
MSTINSDTSKTDKIRTAEALNQLCRDTLNYLPKKFYSFNFQNKKAFG